MAAPGIRISCPNCQQQMTVPDAVRGKKVRCKGCGGAIPVPAGGIDTRVRTEQAQAKAKAAAAHTEENEGANPYDVTETNLDPRCPHCAYPLDPPDARICLHCGYDMLRRARQPKIITFERTAGDWFKWLLPGIGSLLLFFAIIGGCVYYHYFLPYDILKTKEADDLLNDRLAVFNHDPGPDAINWLFHPMIELWVAIVCLWIMWKLGKFAFKRLIINYMPPERIKEK